MHENVKTLALMPFGVYHPSYTYTCTCNYSTNQYRSPIMIMPSLSFWLLPISSTFRWLYITFFVHIQHADEVKYKFATPSTMKPTQIKCSEGSINQLPPWTEIQGDIRLTPFYDVDECMKKIMGYVEELNSGEYISDSIVTTVAVKKHHFHCNLYHLYACKIAQMDCKHKLA